MARGAGNALERALRRDRQALVAGIAAITALAGLYTVAGIGMDMSAIEMTAMARDPPAGPMAAMGAMAMTGPPWTPAYAALVFLMWWVMMTAMMLPSAAPMILLHAALRRRTRPGRATLGRSALFLAGYLGAWAAFSALATALQWLGERGGWLSPAMMQVSSGLLAGGILVAAGLYQLSPAKQACLAHCRNPVGFLTRHHRPGPAGTLRLGVIHGSWCLGCCWALMALLFVGGIMNLWWIAGLALLVLVEKLLPRGVGISRLAGGLLACAGGLVLAAGAGLV